MNDARRKALSALRDKIEECQSECESLRDEEQDYFDNMPENMQSGEKGERAEAATTELDSAIDSLQEAINAIEGSQE